MTTYAFLAIKTIHIVSVISWMAGLLYFYRLFVYHKEYGVKSVEVHNVLSLMEHRLYRFITLPAMIASVASGLIMAVSQSQYFSELWFQLKMLSVLLLILMTWNGARFIKKFRNLDLSNISGLQLRLINEIPTILMIIAVSMVVFRPV